MKNSFRLLALIAIGAVLAACSSSHHSTPGAAAVRLVNITGVDGLTLTATLGSTASTLASGVAQNSHSDYASVGTGGATVVVAGGNLTASSAQSVSFASGVYYTVVAYQRNGGISTQIITDNLTTPASGFALVNISNPASDAGPVDVYVVQHGATIDDTVAPKFQNVFSGGSSLAQSIVAGTYDVVVTGYTKPLDVRLVMSNVVLGDGAQINVVLTNTTGGTLLNGTLVSQNTAVTSGGGLEVHQNDKARLRFIGAFAGLYRLDYAASNSVSDSVISNGIGANSYQLVPAGTAVSSVTLTVSGQAAVSPTLSGSVTTALQAGGDYTLLAYGDSTSPSVMLISDNNQAPAAARIRVINAVYWAGSGVFNVASLYNGSASLFSRPIAYSGVSTYAGLPTGTSHLTAQVEALSSPLVAIEDGKNMALGGVYTLILGGTNSAFDSALIVDRCLPNIVC